jgi:membrane-associated protease RseP (regulator of RpoE activity)
MHVQPVELREVFVIQPPKRPYWIHISLFLLTIFTTLVVGARLQFNFLHGYPLFINDPNFFPLRWIWQQPSRLLLGFPFCASLLGILFAHEMGHFLYSVRHRVYATLPFFIPAPTPIGTFGAFIQIRSRFQSRHALFDIGIAGPIAGFLIAVPLALLGLAWSVPLPFGTEAQMGIGHPPVFELLFGLLKVTGWFPGVPLSEMFFHPVALAAWIGMLATALNLLPGGQLDGGHIIYALRPSLHGPVTLTSMILLVPLAFFFWPGWLIWVFGLLLTRRHPWVPDHPALDGNRRLLAFTALLIFALTFTPEPFLSGSFYELLFK